MYDLSDIINSLVEEDPRYKREAYIFIRDALSYGQDVLKMGTPETSSEESILSLGEEGEELDLDEELDPLPEAVERHLTGQQLCESIRCYALDQYGYMAKVVLNSWGLYGTGDFGEVVYNLIRTGAMRRSQNDRREDFDDCYDFDTAFQQEYQIEMPQD